MRSMSASPIVFTCVAPNAGSSHVTASQKRATTMAASHLRVFR
jgi:hypothetical protein